MSNIERIAIVADIHANIYALNTFLEYIDSHFPTEKILNLGDFVLIGPHPKEVSEVIFNDSRFINIIGNNEMVVLNRKKEDWDHAVEPHAIWTRNQIGEDLLKKIGNLPTSKYLNVGALKLLMIHSHFYDKPNRNIRDNLLIYEERTLEEFIADYPKDVDVVLVGHSHEPLYICWQEKHIINPGTLSVSKKPRIYFCLMEIEGNNINLNFKNIEYDTRTLKQDFESRKVKERMFLMNYFYPFL